MAKDHPELVKMALEIKRIGNDIMEKVGGREIHPVSPRVGGFSQAPRASASSSRCCRGWSGRSSRCPASPTSSRRCRAPSLPRQVEIVSMVNPTEYPINEGSMASTTGRALGRSTSTRT